MGDIEEKRKFYESISQHLDLTKEDRMSEVLTRLVPALINEFRSCPVACASQLTKIANSVILRCKSIENFRVPFVDILKKHFSEHGKTPICKSLYNQVLFSFLDLIYMKLDYDEKVSFQKCFLENVEKLEHDNEIRPKLVIYFVQTLEILKHKQFKDEIEKYMKDEYSVVNSKYACLLIILNEFLSFPIYYNNSASIIFINDCAKASYEKFLFRRPGTIKPYLKELKNDVVDFIAEYCQHPSITFFSYAIGSNEKCDELKMLCQYHMLDSPKDVVPANLFVNIAFKALENIDLEHFGYEYVHRVLKHCTLLPYVYANVKHAYALFGHIFFFLNHILYNFSEDVKNPSAHSAEFEKLYTTVPGFKRLIDMTSLFCASDNNFYSFFMESCMGDCRNDLKGIQSHLYFFRDFLKIDKAYVFFMKHKKRRCCKETKQIESQLFQMLSEVLKRSPSKLIEKYRRVLFYFCYSDIVLYHLLEMPVQKSGFDPKTHKSKVLLDNKCKEDMNVKFQEILELLDVVKLMQVLFQEMIENPKVEMSLFNTSFSLIPFFLDLTLAKVFLDKNGMVFIKECEILLHLMKEYYKGVIEKKKEVLCVVQKGVSLELAYTENISYGLARLYKAMNANRENEKVRVGSSPHLMTYKEIIQHNIRAILDRCSQFFTYDSMKKEVLRWVSYIFDSDSNDYIYFANLFAEDLSEEDINSIDPGFLLSRNKKVSNMEEYLQVVSKRIYHIDDQYRLLYAYVEYGSEAVKNNTEKGPYDEEEFHICCALKKEHKDDPFYKRVTILDTSSVIPQFSLNAFYYFTYTQFKSVLYPFYASSYMNLDSLSLKEMYDLIERVLIRIKELDVPLSAMFMEVFSYIILSQIDQWTEVSLKNGSETLFSLLSNHEKQAFLHFFEFIVEHSSHKELGIVPYRGMNGPLKKVCKCFVEIALILPNETKSFMQNLEVELEKSILFINVSNNDAVSRLCTLLYVIGYYIEKKKFMNKQECSIFYLILNTWFLFQLREPLSVLTDNQIKLYSYGYNFLYHVFHTYHHMTAYENLFEKDEWKQQLLSINSSLVADGGLHQKAQREFGVFCMNHFKKLLTCEESNFCKHIFLQKYFLKWVSCLSCIKDITLDNEIYELIFLNFQSRNEALTHVIAVFISNYFRKLPREYADVISEHLIEKRLIMDSLEREGFPKTQRENDNCVILFYILCVRVPFLQGLVNQFLSIQKLFLKNLSNTRFEIANYASRGLSAQYFTLSILSKIDISNMDLLESAYTYWKERNDTHLLDISRFTRTEEQHAQVDVSNVNELNKHFIFAFIDNMERYMSQIKDTSNSSRSSSNRSITNYRKMRSLERSMRIKGPENIIIKPSIKRSKHDKLHQLVEQNSWSKQHVQRLKWLFSISNTYNYMPLIFAYMHYAQVQNEGLVRSEREDMLGTHTKKRNTILFFPYEEAVDGRFIIKKELQNEKNRVCSLSLHEFLNIKGNQVNENESNSNDSFLIGSCNLICKAIPSFHKEYGLWFDMITYIYKKMLKEDLLSNETLPLLIRLLEFHPDRSMVQGMRIVEFDFFSLYDRDNRILNMKSCVHLLKECPIVDMTILKCMINYVTQTFIKNKCLENFIKELSTVLMIQSLILKHPIKEPVVVEEFSLTLFCEIEERITFFENLLKKDKHILLQKLMKDPTFRFLDSQDVANPIFACIWKYHGSIEEENTIAQYQALDILQRCIVLCHDSCSFSTLMSLVLLFVQKSPVYKNATIPEFPEIPVICIEKLHGKENPYIYKMDISGSALLKITNVNFPNAFIKQNTAWKTLIESYTEEHLLKEGIRNMLVLVKNISSEVVIRNLDFVLSLAIEVYCKIAIEEEKVCTHLCVEIFTSLNTLLEDSSHWSLQKLLLSFDLSFWKILEKIPLYIYTPFIHRLLKDAFMYNNDNNITESHRNKLQKDADHLFRLLKRKQLLPTHSDYNKTKPDYMSEERFLKYEQQKMTNVFLKKFKEYYNKKTLELKNLPNENTPLMKKEILNVLEKLLKGTGAQYWEEKKVADVFQMLMNFVQAEKGKLAKIKENAALGKNASTNMETQRPMKGTHGEIENVHVQSFIKGISEGVKMVQNCRKEHCKIVREFQDDLIALSYIYCENKHLVPNGKAKQKLADGENVNRKHKSSLIKKYEQRKSGNDDKIEDVEWCESIYNFYHLEEYGILDMHFSKIVSMFLYFFKSPLEKYRVLGYKAAIFFFSGFIDEHLGSSCDCLQSSDVVILYEFLEEMVINKDKYYSESCEYTLYFYLNLCTSIILVLHRFDEQKKRLIATQTTPIVRENEYIVRILENKYCDKLSDLVKKITVNDLFALLHEVILKIIERRDPEQWLELTFSLKSIPLTYIHLIDSRIIFRVLKKLLREECIRIGVVQKDGFSSNRIPHNKTSLCFIRFSFIIFALLFSKNSYDSWYMVYTHLVNDTPMEAVVDSEFAKRQFVQGEMTTTRNHMNEQVNTDSSFCVFTTPVSTNTRDGLFYDNEEEFFKMVITTFHKSFLPIIFEQCSEDIGLLEELIKFFSFMYANKLLLSEIGTCADWKRVYGEVYKLMIQTRSIDAFNKVVHILYTFVRIYNHYGKLVNTEYDMHKQITLIPSDLISSTNTNSEEEDIFKSPVLNDPTSTFIFDKFKCITKITRPFSIPDYLIRELTEVVQDHEQRNQN